MQKSMIHHAEMSVEPQFDFPYICHIEQRNKRKTQMTTLSDLVASINAHPALDRKPVTVTTFKKKSMYVDLLARLEASLASSLDALDTSVPVVYDETIPLVDDTKTDDTPAVDDVPAEPAQKTLSVKEYAFDIGVNPKTVRHVIRTKFSNDARYTRYALDAEMIAQLNKHFVKA